MNFNTREMTMSDYKAAFGLWQGVEGVGLSDADTADQIAIFLSRNPGLSFVAFVGENLAGAVLCGHDGRRGYIHHLAVSPAYRRSGIGGRLVERCLHELQLQGIRKCHLFVFTSNHDAITFWEKSGWTLREELRVMSKSIN
jgi:ribosomal protein S18 acetylase RimI-like enzyme